MRKIITTIVALALAFAILLPVEAFAELPDFASMTDEELHDLINAARNELKVRELIAEKDTVILEQDGVKVYLTGNYEVKDYTSSSGRILLRLEAVVVNDTDTTVSIMFDASVVNGWDVGNSAIVDVSSGHKKKDNFEFTISDAEISSYEEIEDMELSMYVYDADNWNRMFSAEKAVVHFN